MLLVISFVVFMLLGLPLFGVIGLASIISMIGMPFPMEFIRICTPAWTSSRSSPPSVS